MAFKKSSVNVGELCDYISQVESFGPSPQVRVCITVAGELHHARAV